MIYQAPHYPPFYGQSPVDLRNLSQRGDIDAAAARGLFALRQLPMFDPRFPPGMNFPPSHSYPEGAPQVPDADSDPEDDDDEEEHGRLGSYDQHAAEGPSRKRRTKNRGNSSPGRDRREYHKTAERKRRTKINDLVTQLHELLPDAAAIPCQKPTVLLHAISHIRKMRAEMDRLTTDNAQMAGEMVRLRGGGGHPSGSPSRAESPVKEEPAPIEEKSL